MLRRNSEPRQGRENHRRERRREMPYQAIPRPADVPGDVMGRGHIRAKIKSKLNGQREEHERLATPQITSQKQSAQKKADPHQRFADRGMPECVDERTGMGEVIGDAAQNTSGRNVRRQSMQCANDEPRRGNGGGRPQLNDVFRTAADRERHRGGNDQRQPFIFRRRRQAKHYRRNRHIAAHE